MRGTKGDMNVDMDQNPVETGILRETLIKYEIIIKEWMSDMAYDCFLFMEENIRRHPFVHTRSLLCYHTVKVLISFNINLTRKCCDLSYTPHAPVCRLTGTPVLSAWLPHQSSCRFFLTFSWACRQNRHTGWWLRVFLFDPCQSNSRVISPEKGVLLIILDVMWGNLD